MSDFNPRVNQKRPGHKMKQVQRSLVCKMIKSTYHFQKDFYTRTHIVLHSEKVFWGNMSELKLFYLASCNNILKILLAFYGKSI